MTTTVIDKFHFYIVVIFDRFHFADLDDDNELVNS